MCTDSERRPKATLIHVVSDVVAKKLDVPDDAQRIKSADEGFVGMYRSILLDVKEVDTLFVH